MQPHCRFVFLRSKICYPLLSASPRGYALRFATVAVIGSGRLLSSNKILPMLGTLGQNSFCAGLQPGMSENPVESESDEDPALDPCPPRSPPRPGWTRVRDPRNQALRPQ